MTNFTMRNAQSPKNPLLQSLEGSTFFKPAINQKSELLDKKLQDKRRQSAVDAFSSERALLILEKGKEYEKRVEQRRESFRTKELEGCTFVPMVN